MGDLVNLGSIQLAHAFSARTFGCTSLPSSLPMPPGGPVEMEKVQGLCREWRGKFCFASGNPCADTMWILDTVRPV